MTRRADVPDIMARVAATLEDAARTPDGARGVLEPAPEGDADVNVGRLRHLADIDVELPSRPDRPLGGGAVQLAKRGVRRALRWYFGPTMAQLSHLQQAPLDQIERL